MHLNPMLDEPVSADLLVVGLVFRVSGAVQLGDDFAAIKLVASMQDGRASVNFRRITEDLAAHALVYNALVLDIEKGENAQRDRAHDQEGSQANFYDGPREGSPPVTPMFGRFRGCPVFCAGGLGFYIQGRT